MIFDLFKKKNREPELDFSVVGTDLHSHFIPGIDDGAQTIEQSLALISKMKDLGFSKLITTPHIMADYFRNTPEIILKGLDIVREALLKNNIDIQLEAAAEYYFDENFQSKLDKGPLLTLGKDFVLFELSFVNFPTNVFDGVARLQDKGYTPILAHPERYPYFYGFDEILHRFKATGCYLQINTLSLTGYYGVSTQKAAEHLVDSDLVDFIGSDMHHLRHAAALKKSLNMPYIKRLLSDYHLQNRLL